MDTTERARLAAQARWAKKSPQERREETSVMRAKARPKEGTALKRLRTMADKYGFDLVPKDDA